MKIKSYNKLPDPLADFALNLSTRSAASTLAMATGRPGIKEAVAGFLDAACPVVGMAPPDATAFTVALLATASLVISVYVAAHGYRSFHNSVWAGERPSTSRAYGSARIVSRSGALRGHFSVWRKGKDFDAGLVVGDIGSNRSRLLVAPVQNALVMGGIGSGKTTSCLAPPKSRSSSPSARP